MGPGHHLLIPTYTGLPVLPTPLSALEAAFLTATSHTPSLFNNLDIWRAGTGLPDEGSPYCWEEAGHRLARLTPVPHLPPSRPQVYMNAVWHGWAIPMFLFLAILRLSLNYLIAR